MKREEDGRNLNITRVLNEREKNVICNLTIRQKEDKRNKIKEDKRNKIQENFLFSLKEQILKWMSLEADSGNRKKVLVIKYKEIILIRVL